METTEIKLTRILNTLSSFVVFKGKVYDYNGRSRIYSSNIILLDDLKNKAQLYSDTINSDFNEFSVLSDFNYTKKNRNHLIEYYTERFNSFGVNEISTYRQLNPKETSSFYKFEISIEIDGILIEPDRYVQYSQYPDDLIVLFHNKKHLYLSRKEIPAPMEPRSKAHLVPKEKVNRIIGKKRFKKTKWIGTEKEDEFTGEEEVFVLDLNNFDEDIYLIFKEHGAIEMQFTPSRPSVTNNI